MFKTLDLSLLFLLGIMFFQCADEVASPPDKNIRKLTTVEKRLVESDNQFGLTLFKQINEIEKDKNVFISPLSVSMALGMALNGASGSTKQTMQTTLQLEGLTMQEINESYQSLIKLLTTLDPKVIFEIANSIWYRQEFTFEQEFINLNKTYFNAEVRGLDFNSPGAPNIINQWVSEQTQGKINKIIDKIDDNMVMYLLNAIYFKGIWSYEFDKSLTEDDQFRLVNGSQISCKMMNQTANFRYFETADFQAIDLPYGDGDFSMLIFLPRPSKNIDSLTAEFNRHNWNQWINSFSEQKGILQLPKFTIEYEITLNEVLKALGMAIAFDPNRADFSNIYKNGNLCISEVKHKTFVKIDEEGTEAAAVTSVGIVVTSVGSQPFTMRVDHPFIFVIQDKHSQTILFMGKIMEPKEGI